jgi:hypothetical protein
MSKSLNGSARTARPGSQNTQSRTTQSKNARSAGGAGPRRNPRRGRPVPATFRARHPVLTALVPVALVVAAIATMVVIKAAGGAAGAGGSSHLQAAGTGTTNDASTTSLSPAVLAALSVPASALNSVGSPSDVVLPEKVGGTTTALGSDGKPLITYVGAEYCPYCAAERWALAVALSRFGTLSGLSGTHSSDSDVYPDTQTLSFYGSSYASPYLDFQSVEEATNQPEGGTYQTLQTPSAAQSRLLSTYDGQGSIPFVDIANRYVISGASYSPQVLAGLSRPQIVAELSDPSSAVAQAIDGTANDITAALCAVTGDQPASVCNSAGVVAATKALGA